MKSAINTETLKVLDRPVEENQQIKRTLTEEIDLKNELKKVLGLKASS